MPTANSPLVANWQQQLVVLLEMYLKGWWNWSRRHRSRWFLEGFSRSLGFLAWVLFIYWVIEPPIIAASGLLPPVYLLAALPITLIIAFSELLQAAGRMTSREPWEWGLTLSVSPKAWFMARFIYSSLNPLVKSIMYFVAVMAALLWRSVPLGNLLVLSWLLLLIPPALATRLLLMILVLSLRGWVRTLEFLRFVVVTPFFIAVAAFGAYRFALAAIRSLSQPGTSFFEVITAPLWMLVQRVTLLELSPEGLFLHITVGSVVLILAASMSFRAWVASQSIGMEPAAGFLHLVRTSRLLTARSIMFLGQLGAVLGRDWTVAMRRKDVYRAGMDALGFGLVLSGVLIAVSREFAVHTKGLALPLLLISEVATAITWLFRALPHFSPDAEGKRYYWIATAPLMPEVFLWAKAFGFTVPGVLLSLFSGSVLSLSLSLPFTSLLATVPVLLMVVGTMAAICIGATAMFPWFDHPVPQLAGGGFLAAFVYQLVIPMYLGLVGIILVDPSFRAGEVEITKGFDLFGLTAIGILSFAVCATFVAIGGRRLRCMDH